MPGTGKSAYRSDLGVEDPSGDQADPGQLQQRLNREGHECSVGLVADLMRELGLRAVQPRAYKGTTVPGEQPEPAPDLISRDFTLAAPGQRLVGDSTYLKTDQGWLYLATVIDLATRMVVGGARANETACAIVSARRMNNTGGRGTYAAAAVRHPAQSWRAGWRGW
ncbi:hypothetical protein ABN028_34150 [Actinopolymorpha sp. B17G11]|uniref:hypothetical protein n=1 Tax=Actinopolymorpha sp. B17G11 TaxID=3160861 RepID=UPI0032E503C9